MRIKILLLFYIVCLSSYAKTIRMNINHDKMGGVSLEKELFNYKKYDIGLGASWLEVNEETNRLFPIYGTFKINTNKAYFIFRGGMTTGEENYRYFESSVGKDMGGITYELGNQHFDNENYLKLSAGIEF